MTIHVHRPVVEGTYVMTGYQAQRIALVAADLTEVIDYQITHVRVTKPHHQYTVRCARTHAVLKMGMTHKLMHTEVVPGLHPVEAGFMGMEYSRYLAITQQPDAWPLAERARQSRYGQFFLDMDTAQVAMVHFVDKTTQHRYAIHPYDMVLCVPLMSGFDALQAFYIGLLAGRSVYGEGNKP